MRIRRFTDRAIDTMGVFFSIPHGLVRHGADPVRLQEMAIRSTVVPKHPLVAAVRKQRWVGESQPALVGVDLRRMVDLKLDSASSAWRIKIDKYDSRRRRRPMTRATASAMVDFIVVGCSMSYTQLRRRKEEPTRKEKKRKRVHIERGRIAAVRPCLSHRASLGQTIDSFGRECNSLNALAESF